MTHIHTIQPEPQPDPVHTTAVEALTGKVPVCGSTSYLGLGVWRADPVYVFNAADMRLICEALGVPFDPPKFHDSDIGWIK